MKVLLVSLIIQISGSYWDPSVCICDVFVPLLCFFGLVASSKSQEKRRTRNGLQAEHVFSIYLLPAIFIL